MSGKKYKLKITSAGVGDPFLLLKARFEDGGDPPDGGSWSLPSAHPINGFNLHIYFCGGDACGTDSTNYNEVGKIEVGRIATDNYYFFGLPFDQGDFDLGDTLNLMLRATSDESGDLVYIYGDDLGTDHLTYFQTFEYSDQSSDLGSVMVYYKWEDT
jgi:hypothetical protein